MASAIQVLEDGPRNYVIKVTCDVVETGTVIVTPSALAIPCNTVRLDMVEYDVGVGSSMELVWDATAGVTMLTLNEGSGQTFDFRDTGGLNNNAGAGKTGRVLLNKTGTSKSTAVLWFYKKQPNPML